MIVKVTWISNQ